MRENWKFGYKAIEVLEATKLKVLYHKARIDFWRGVKKDTIDKIKAGGITIDESLIEADQFVKSAVSNYGRGPAVSIDDALLRDLNECHTKIREHSAKLLEYEGWLDVLEAQDPKTPLDLDYKDYLYFFGSIKKVADEDSERNIET